MIKKLFLLFVTLFFTALHVNAQESIAVSDTLVGWDHGWVAGLNGSQSSYSNWSQGGVNNISFIGNSTYRSYFRDGRFSYGFLVNTRYGLTRLEDDGTRKIDDRLSIRNRFLYDIGHEDSDFSVYGNFNFRTQFGDGFNYGAGEDGADVLISGFLSPAYISQNVGLAYSPGDHFSFEAGVGLRQTIVTDDNVLANVPGNFGLPEGDNFRNEAGINIGASYEQSIATNLIMSSSVETFTNINGAITSTDIFFSSEVIGQINRYLNASVRLDIIYDDDFSNRVQIRQGLSLGISFILI